MNIVESGTAVVLWSWLDMWKMLAGKNNAKTFTTKKVLHEKKT